MPRIKVSTNFPAWPLLRQTPGQAGAWGDCTFLVNQEVDECDFWVVLDGLAGPEATRCAPENTLLVTCEPPDVKSYSPSFIRQFGAVLTSHRDLDHSRIINDQQGLPWMIGARLEPKALTWTDFMSFEDLQTKSAPKTRLLSIVAAKDKATPGHHARNRFIEELKREMGDQVDVFGLGYLPIADKWDAIAPYRYHLAIENSEVDDYWTEKLADAFLGLSFPIYCGCPNISKYFADQSMVRLNIDDPVAAAASVRKIVASDLDLQRHVAVAEAKQRVLNEYNLFAVLDHYVTTLRQPHGTPAAALVLSPETNMATALPARRPPIVSRFSDWLLRRRA
jgi:hypothetical protein